MTQAGATLGGWPITVMPDQPPTVAFAKPPEPTARQALRLEYQATDDYGVESVKAVIRRQDGRVRRQARARPAVCPGLHLKEAQATSYHDLTPHPWAGLPVEIRLVATDALGQTGESETVRMTLPERVFHNPIARAIIEQRKELANDPRSRLPVAEILGDLRSRPRLYRDDMVVFLALRVGAGSGCSYTTTQPRSRRSSSCCGTRRCGSRTGKRRWPRTSLRRLQQAVAGRAGAQCAGAEIERLMSELQQALDRYLQALAQNMAQQSRAARAAGRSVAQVVTSRDLAAHARPRRASWPGPARATRRGSCCRSCRTCWRTCAWRSRASCKAATRRSR